MYEVFQFTAKNKWMTVHEFLIERWGDSRMIFLLGDGRGGGMKEREKNIKQLGNIVKLYFCKFSLNM